MDAVRPSASGRLELLDDTLVYADAHQTSWRLPISSLSVIGEYTNQSGPVLDDWYLVFVAAGSTDFYLASVYETGTDAVRDALAIRLGGSFGSCLANSADFKSIVLWPPALAGSELMTFTRQPRNTFIGRLADLLLPLTNVALSPEVAAYALRVGV
jgi:hypothetical protein